MKTGMIFDLDGTLLDSLADLHSATNVTLAHFGCPARTLEEVRQFVGNGARRLLELALPGTPEDPDLEEVLEFYKAYYAAHSRERTAPYPGIPEALRRLGQRHPLAIVSNKPDNAVKILCQDYFPGIYALGEHTGCPRKPAPDMVYTCMKDLGVDRCIYIGDSEVDVLTAKNAGVPCLSVTWGFRDEELIRAHGGRWFCRTPEELPERLEQLLEEYHGQ